MSTRHYPTTPMCDGTLLAAFEPTTRPTDVFVATSAKCGQTWLLALLHHLRTGGNDPEFSGKGVGVTPWLEQPRDMAIGVLYDREKRLAEIAALPDPRVFKLHVTFDEVPRPAGSTARVITILRDPRDVPWSMYEHLRGMRPEILGPDPLPAFDEWFDTWLARGYFFEVTRSFWPHRADPDVAIFRYEDLKADLSAEARKLVAFLGWPVDDAALSRAVALSQLGAMQASESKLGMGAAFKEGHRFVREGAVGRNRGRLSESQHTRIVGRARQELDPECFAFLFQGSTASENLARLASPDQG